MQRFGRFSECAGAVDRVQDLKNFKRKAYRHKSLRPQGIANNLHQRFRALMHGFIRVRFRTELMQSWQRIISAAQPRPIESTGPPRVCESKPFAAVGIPLRECRA
ncbi:hypothetical protein J2797_006605 [Paraburkholderia terricola]|nr:hypothetical protein [Paraburkholderia terricola]MDR6496678.1 hypothetical protein [Paraburkholderia terricola]